jgi:hypothetical protein
MIVFLRFSRHIMAAFEIWRLEVFLNIILVQTVGFLDYSLYCKGLTYEKPMDVKGGP